MNYLASLLISSLLGFLVIHTFTQKKPIDLLQKIILSCGIGLGLSGQIVFYSLLLNKSYSATLIWGLHAGLIALLIALNIVLARQNPKIKTKFRLEQRTLIGLGVLALLLIPLWRQAHFFPFGGWDAWSCWNLKARFIFLGADHWQNMFDPVLWRSNNHYPFLLPLINAWGWSFYGDANLFVPMFNAIAFPFLTAAIMFTSLDKLTRSRFAVLPSMALFSIPFIVTLSISQYSDIVVAFYFLSALCCLIQAKIEENSAWAVLSGLCVGLMSFTKTEGSVAAVIIMAMAFPFFLAERRPQSARLLGYFVISALIAFLPTIIFKWTMAPGNTAFINGLASADAPSGLMRIQATFMFLAVELIGTKWNGLWILLLMGAILGGTQCFRNGRWIVPAAIAVFLAVAIAYYYINTYFEIVWWLKTTLNRILYIILPALVWWVFYSLWLPKKK